MNKITLGFSPCPNDTFIFDALVNHKIDTGEYRFEVFMEDVETLNEWAIEARLDVSKISYGVLHKVREQYYLLNSGGAMGRGVGPLLIGKYPTVDWENVLVAIPGEHTTAHHLLMNAFPTITRKVFLRYDQIESFVAEGKGLGVIIHENRFTYGNKGLYKIADLGQMWEQKTGYPIPLGGIVAKRNLESSLINNIDLLINQSVAFALKNNDNLSQFVKCNAIEMDESVMRKHIDLYVNHFSLQLGNEGKNAVGQFMGEDIVGLFL